MTATYSANDVIGFLDYLSSKGLLKSNTASSRKAAANAFFEILDDEEKLDVRELNIDEVAMRFANIQGDKFTPDSLKTYKSRFNTALSDFLRYRKDPMGFSIKSAKRTSKPKPTTKTASKKNERVKVETDTAVKEPSSNGNVVIFPIPLRTDLTVKIANLPSDMTQAEAKRIANVVMALAAE